MATNDLNQQLAHASSEMDEIGDAAAYGEGATRIAEEILDCMHSLESALRILQEQGLNVSLVADMVIKKNIARGYYDD